MAKIKKGFIAEGTVCNNCETTIVKQAKSVEGVEEATFDFSKEIGHVTYNDEKTDIDEILDKIEEKGYTCFILAEGAPQSKKSSSPLGWILGVVGILVVAYFIFNFVKTINLPQISQNMGYGLLFLVGLLTGFHCISMCGGFVVGYTTKDAQEGKKSHKSHLMYAVGKTISYTIIGAIFGLLGSIIAFTPMLRGVAGLIAGLFLLVFGLKMLNIIPALRKFSLKTPKFLTRFVGKNQNSSPLVIGLLNGLMIACGPLQAIYIMAAGTGSLVEGAKLLFVFGLGTLPAMIGFGYFASFLSGKATQKILKASGSIVIVLGLVMINNGLVLTGSGLDFGSLTTSASQSSTGSSESDSVTIVDGYQIINMEVNRYGWSPDTFVLKKGVPVKWVIDGKEINGCNNAIQVPKYGLDFDIVPGEQTIEFTPTEEGVVRWSCWMGMIPGTFIVKEDVSDSATIAEELASAPPAPAGSCDGSCGGGCGGGCGSGCGGAR